MKYVNKLLLLGVASMVLVSCEGLDTEYKGAYVTTDQKEAVLQRNPEMAQAGVAGISAIASTYETVFSNHFDFGQPAIMIGLDLQSNDYVCVHSGYNWFSYWEGFTSPTPTGTPTQMAWYHIYDQIFTCNAMLQTTGDEPEADLLKFYAAQAKATRAYDYFMLAQLYQFNVAIVDASAPTVPLITEKNQAEVEQNGCPRATVAELYAQINDDINEAVRLIEASGYSPSDLMDVKPRRMFSLATAYGLRARINLVQHKYAEAADDATRAIANFAGAPLSRQEAARPGFNSLDANNWMWGIAIAETDRVVTSGIVNFPSMQCTFCSNGYVAVGAWKYAAADLFANIPSSDCRKGWFLDDNGNSPSLNAAEKKYLAEFDDLPAYTNVKFAGYQGVVGQSLNASDIPLMRIEEMYYIQAEGLAMSGHTTDAVNALNAFVQKYRNPKYSCEATSAEDIQEEIWQQRRIELWGEGLAFFDLMRLDKPVDRKGLNWPNDYSFYIPGYTEDQTAGKLAAYALVYCIPQGEINGNPALSQADNNPNGIVPHP